MPWNMANWKWSECQLVEELLTGLHTGVPGEHALPSWLQEQYKPYDPYEKQKREKFIRLLCKVKSEPEYDEKKKVRDDIKITVDDVALVIKAVSGIDIKAITEE